MRTKLRRTKGMFAAIIAMFGLFLLLAPNNVHASIGDDYKFGPELFANAEAIGKVDNSVNPLDSGKETFFCTFQDNARVACVSEINLSIGSWNPSSNTKHRHDYYYNPVQSKKMGFDVFSPELNGGDEYSGTGGTGDNNGLVGILYFPDSPSGNYNNSYLCTLGPDAMKTTFDKNKGDCYNDSHVDTDNIKLSNSNPNICSLDDLEKANPTGKCVLGGKGNGQQYDLAAVFKDSKYKSGYASYTPEDEGSCADGGALGFILCPIQKLLNDAVTKISSIIVSMLNVPTSEFQDPQLKEIFGTVLVIANSLFALVFLIAIFANTLAIDKIDNYTIKKALPRLVIAVLLSQFAYYISIAVIEIGNVLGAAIPQTLFSSLDASLNFNPSSVVNSLAGILFSIIFLLIALVAFLIGIFVLALRQIILIGIVLTGPVAFAAWVLPGTEKGFKFWWTNLVKLSLMYPIMSTLIVGSLKLSEIIQATNSANIAVKLGALALPIVAMLYLPKTFKWSGQLMSGTAGKISDYGTKKTKGLAKDSAKEGKIAEGINKGADKLMDTPFGKGITRTPMLGTAVQKNLGSRAKRIESKQNLESLPGSRLEKMATQGHKGAAEVLKKKYAEELDKQESRAAKGLDVDATKLVSLRTAIGGVEKPGSVENNARATSEANRLANAATNYVNSAPAGTTRQMPQITYSKKADGDGVVRDYFAGTRHTKPGVAPPAVAPGAPTLTQPGPAVVLTAPAPGGGVAAVPPPHGGHP